MLVLKFGSVDSSVGGATVTVTLNNHRCAAAPSHAFPTPTGWAAGGRTRSSRRSAEAALGAGSAPGRTRHPGAEGMWSGCTSKEGRGATSRYASFDRWPLMADLSVKARLATTPASDAGRGQASENQSDQCEDGAACPTRRCGARGACSGWRGYPRPGRRGYPRRGRLVAPHRAPLRRKGGIRPTTPPARKPWRHK